jgi:pimeloyl-ACP methyl ester carboxylesterase
VSFQQDTTVVTRRLPQPVEWRIPVRGAAVRCVTAGSGSLNVALVHGWAGRIEQWRFQLGALAAEGVRVLALDLPGHGQSEPPREPCSMALCAEAVRAALEAADVRDAVLVAHSLGISVASRFYRDHPDRVRGLISVDGAVLGYGLAPTEAAAFVARYRGEDYGEQVRRYARAHLRHCRDAELREEICRAMAQTPQPVAVPLLDSLFDEAAWRVERIAVPLLLLNAPSPRWSEDYLRRVRELAPQCQVQTVPGAGHFLMLERPAEVTAALRNFLDQVKVAEDGRRG